jgi:predicted HTH transcriptional regulator
VVDVGGSTVTFIFLRKKNEELATAGTTPKTTPKATPETTSKTTSKTAPKTTPKFTRGEQGLSVIKQRILDAIRKDSHASTQMLAELIGGITKDGVKYHLVKLQKMGLLRHNGPVRGGHWEVLM